jgi:hypothetical protein
MMVGSCGLPCPVPVPVPVGGVVVDAELVHMLNSDMAAPNCYGLHALLHSVSGCMWLAM